MITKSIIEINEWIRFNQLKARLLMNSKWKDLEDIIYKTCDYCHENKNTYI